MQEEIQANNAVLMVRPAAFGFNPETAATNAFAARAQPDCSQAALAEFDHAVERLQHAGVEVLVLDDSLEPAKPDAAFPNNWVSFHAGGRIVVYAMATPTRRLERRVDALVEVLTAHGFSVSGVIDLTGHEESGRFLEGTGSLILDRPCRRAYAALGPRTCSEALEEFSERLDYSIFAFDAADCTGQPIYHTNVMMSLGTHFAMLCPEVVAAGQRKMLMEDIEASGRTLITVDYDQMRHFTCNILELRTAAGDPLVAMSASAKACLRPDQLAVLEQLGGKLIDVPIPTIEAVGGGSLRCMIADIHLPRISPGS